jgi:alanine-alpha-ketoisovalerate/valine-pyruvate aminotransferase
VTWCPWAAATRPLWDPNTIVFMSLSKLGLPSVRTGIVVVPGEFFFPGLEEDWQHKKECLRVSYAHDPDKVAKGIKTTCEEAKRARGPNKKPLAQ